MLEAKILEAIRSLLATGLDVKCSKDDRASYPTEYSPTSNTEIIVSVNSINYMELATTKIRREQALFAVSYYKQAYSKSYDFDLLNDLKSKLYYKRIEITAEEQSGTAPNIIPAKKLKLLIRPFQVPIPRFEFNGLILCQVILEVQFIGVPI